MVSYSLGVIKGSQGDPGSQARGDTGPPIFGIRKTIAFSSNAQSRFQPIVLDSALEPWHLARRSGVLVSLYFQSTRRVEDPAHEGSEDRDKGVTGRIYRK